MARGTDPVVAITVNSGNKKRLVEITLESVMFSSIHMHVVGGVFFHRSKSVFVLYDRVDEVKIEIDCHSSDFCQV